MSNRPTTLERAFEIAKSGSCLGAGEISLSLAKEGYDHAVMQMHGPALVRQLGALCRQSQMSAVRVAPGGKKPPKTSIPAISRPV